MIPISRLLGAALPLVLLAGAMPVSSQTAAAEPINESTSSSLFTFSREERLVRVAAVFAASDSAIVPSRVRFLDQGGSVLKEVHGNLSEGHALVAELTRADVAGRGDLLVRVEVAHSLPGVRPEGYSIVVSTQSIDATGSPKAPIDWGGGSCARRDGKPIKTGPYLSCHQPAFDPH
jgi:hypothetical protein